ncbi:MAG: hypothetical protein K6G56_06925 [Clostridiales bacterium]|nr:hypothetical protein [Clostridiales bacterium]
MRSRLVSIILIVVFSALFLTGCRKTPNDFAKDTDAPAKTTPDPSAGELATKDPNATEIPQWMTTPDPAKYELGDDGYFEDDFLSANWPPFLVYRGHLFSNNAQYGCYLEDGKKLLFSYVTDEGADYEKEVAGFTKETYEQYMQENLNSYYFIKEFEYLTIDGHPAMRVRFDYDPPEDHSRLTHVLEYCINVNGWVLGLTFTTQSDSFPPICDECMKTIKFKEGY